MKVYILTLKSAAVHIPYPKIIGVYRSNDAATRKLNELLEYMQAEIMEPVEDIAEWLSENCVFTVREAEMED